MSEVSYATLGFLDRNVEAALDAVAAAGFRHTEILGQEPHLDAVPTGKALVEFRSRLRSRGLSGATVHAPLRRNVLGAPEEDWRREKVQVLSDYLHFAAAIDAPHLIVHPVPNPGFVPGAEHPEMPTRIGDAVHRSLDDLVPVARSAGVRILLENLPYSCEYPFLSLKELRLLIDQYPADAVGLVIDTGHAWTSKIEVSTEILAAGSRLWGTHLQDVDYEDPQDNHWVPTHGDLDWDAIRSSLVEVNYAGQWTFEVSASPRGGTPEELARACQQVARSWGF